MKMAASVVHYCQRTEKIDWLLNMFAPVKLLGVDKGTLNHACMEVLVLHNFVYVCRGFDKKFKCVCRFQEIL